MNRSVGHRWARARVHLQQRNLPAAGVQRESLRTLSLGDTRIRCTGVARSCRCGSEVATDPFVGRLWLHAQRRIAENRVMAAHLANRSGMRRDSSRCGRCRV